MKINEKNITVESKLSKEEELVLLLSDLINPDINRIDELLSDKLDWYQVLGILTYNRTAGLAYEVISKSQNFNNINREFKFALYSIYEFQKLRAQEINKEVIEISQIFKENNIQHAFLKGTVLALTLYPLGCRASNDVDLLVNSEDVTMCGKLLNQLGFIQGHYNIQTKVIQPASRHEIIRSKLNYGEVVPYEKAINSPGVNSIRIDLNFSLDWKATGTEQSVRNFLQNGTSDYCVNDMNIRSLSPEYFLIHLCMHFYKEAVGLRWVINQRDLSLYKLIDMYVCINDNKFQLDWNKFNKIIKENNIESECYYALKVLSDVLIFTNNNEFLKEIELLKPKNIDYINLVIDPKHPDIKFKWKNDTIDRFFNLLRQRELIPLVE